MLVQFNFLVALVVVEFLRAMFCMPLLMLDNDTFELREDNTEVLSDPVSAPIRQHVGFTPMHVILKPVCKVSLGVALVLVVLLTVLHQLLLKLVLHNPALPHIVLEDGKLILVVHTALTSETTPLKHGRVEFLAFSDDSSPAVMSRFDQFSVSFLHQLDVFGLALGALHAPQVDQMEHVLLTVEVVHTSTMSCSMGGFLLTYGALAGVLFLQID